MASLPERILEPAAISRVPTLRLVPSSAPLFGHAEQLAILIGSRDPLRSRLLFGRRESNPLADPRLEAIRRLVLALRRRRDPGSAIADAAAAGIIPGQIDQLVSRYQENRKA